MKIQAYLTAAAVNLKRLAAALHALFLARIAFRGPVLTNKAHPGSKILGIQHLRSIAV